MLNAYFGIFTNLIRLSIISYNRGVGEREVDSLIPFLDLCKTFIIRKVAVNCNKRFIEIETLIISVCCCRIIWWRVTIHCFPSAVSKRDVKTGTSLLHLRLNFQKKKMFFKHFDFFNFVSNQNSYHNKSFMFLCHYVSIFYMIVHTCCWCLLLYI